MFKKYKLPLLFSLMALPASAQESTFIDGRLEIAGSMDTEVLTSDMIEEDNIPIAESVCSGDVNPFSKVAQDIGNGFVTRMREDGEDVYASVEVQSLGVYPNNLVAYIPPVLACN